MNYIDKQNELLDSPASSAWLKSAIRALNSRDPIDAVSDVETLHELVELRLNETFAGYSFDSKWRGSNV